jgi:hypothetical protein
VNCNAYGLSESVGHQQPSQPAAVFSQRQPRRWREGAYSTRDLSRREAIAPEGEAAGAPAFVKMLADVHMALGALAEVVDDELGGEARVG